MKLILPITSAIIFFLFSLFLFLPTLHFLLEEEHHQAINSSCSASEETNDCAQFIYFHELNNSCENHVHLIEKKSHCLLCASLLNFKSTDISQKFTEQQLAFFTEKRIQSTSFKFVSFYIFNKESRGPPIDLIFEITFFSL